MLTRKLGSSSLEITGMRREDQVDGVIRGVEISLSGDDMKRIEAVFSE
ncbi:MAG: hypothetical protein JXA95_11110 [Spirochaetales bacterium]|nr:hypothetical protein [Spirochaetales bacterium]